MSRNGLRTAATVGLLGLNTLAVGLGIANMPDGSEITREGDKITTVTENLLAQHTAVEDVTKDLNGDGLMGDVIEQSSRPSNTLIGGSALAAADALIIPIIVSGGRRQAS